MKKKRAEREDIFRYVIDEVKKRLDELNIQAEITGRPKHIYSIYRKMAIKINNSMKYMIC